VPADLRTRSRQQLRSAPANTQFNGWRAKEKQARSHEISWLEEGGKRERNKLLEGAVVEQWWTRQGQP